MAVNSRERIMLAFSHREMSSVPMDFSGHRSSGITAIAYHRLREYLGLEPRPIRVYDPIQQLAVVDDDVLDLFKVDTIELGRGFAITDDWWEDWELPDGTPCQIPKWAVPERDDDSWVIRSKKTGKVIAGMPDGSFYFEQTFWPFADDSDDTADMPGNWSECMWQAVDVPPGPQVESEGGSELLREGARALRIRTDRAILGLFDGSLLDFGQSMYRNDNFFMLLAGEPDRANAFLDRLLEIHMERLEQYLGAVGEYIDIVVFADDLGMQTGPVISPAMYREYFKPRHAALWKRAKEIADVKVMLHSCGGIRELMPNIIEAGADAVNPVQINCRGMHLASLKSEYGKDIVFWGGGYDPGTVHAGSSLETIREHVLAQIAIGMDGGGYVFQQVHNFLPDIPPEYIVALFEAVHSF